MANNLTDTSENVILDAINGVAGTLFTTPLKIKLVTVIGTDSTAGTEVTGGTYAQQTIAFTAAAAGSASNTAQIQFTGMPACTVVGFEIVDSAGTPKRIWWIPATANKVVNAGDTYQIAAGGITVSLD
jgi:hypothetical protein